MELKKIGVLSAGKIALLFGVVYGLLSGIIFSIAASQANMISSAGTQLPPIITSLGYWMIIIAPIFDGIVYFIAGIIAAALYNLFAGWIGGIHLELRK